MCMEKEKWNLNNILESGVKMEKYEYKPSGVCCRKIVVEVEGDIVKNVEFIGGCPGNTLGIASLVKGMNVSEVESRLSGIKCGFKNTSCPNELAKFLKEYKNKNN